MTQNKNPVVEGTDMAQYDLLHKNELKFSGITLVRADLNQIARTVAEVLGLATEEVLVTDYLDHVMTLDVLRKTVYPHQIIGKKDILLQLLRQVPGVTLNDDITVTSEGMLGWIGANEDQAREAMHVAEAMVGGILKRISMRAIIFSTGAEVLGGDIKDTNRETISDRLSAEGYTVSFGPTLKDDIELIAGTLRRIAGEGYGLIVTTGGVGAESKDCTVEAVLKLDPTAATPYLCRFEKGHGRHVKDGVRIAVGMLGDTRIVSLPGPNDEVRISMDPLVHGLARNAHKTDFAESLAVPLRDKLRENTAQHHHSNLKHQ
jgi:molybdenum cofactor synthesis domain-containing protein